MNACRKAGGAIFLASLITAGTAQANRSSVTLSEQVRYTESGQAIITCTVAHRGNNFLHHTDYVRVTADGREVARWNFSWRDIPESEIFTREAVLDASGPAMIEAEASCNIHGSKGPASMTLLPPGKTEIRKSP